VLLEGKRILVTGVLNDASMAFAVAREAQEHGAEVILSSFGRVMRITERVAKRLPNPDVQLVELDVSSEADLGALAGAIGGELDGAVHSLAFAPESCLGGGFLEAPWEDVATTVQVSAYSLKALTAAVLPIMPGKGSIVGLDFDNDNVAWPFYDWMGVAKAAFESVARYLARDLGPQGIRVNLVAAGPIRSIAAKSIPGFENFETAWDARAPLGWDVKDAAPVGKAVVALLSDLFPATTGEIVHVDGGYHAIGA
jgi:enoyl ACP reductase